jgi:hypothetical protein
MGRPVVLEDFRMATLLSLTSVGIGDLEVFLPSPPCLLVYTSYADGQPESSVMYLWQDEKTGALHHEFVYLEPAPFETALAWAQSHAPTRGVERIHVKHDANLPGCGKRVAKKAPAKKVAGRRAAPAKTRAAVKTRNARAKKEG